VGVTPSVPVKANSGVRARVPAAGKVLEGDDKPTLLREDQHYLHYITILDVLAAAVTFFGMTIISKVSSFDEFLTFTLWQNFYRLDALPVSQSTASNH